MKIATIIVNYNDDDCTIQYVQRLKQYNIINKIVVVDNMSTTIGAFEKLKEIEDEKTAVIQSNKNGGYNFGNNFGIKYLQENGEKFDYYIISNPDIEISEDGIKTCVNELEKNKSIYKLLRRGEYSSNDFEKDILEVEAISGAFFIIKSEVLNKIGLFDENVFLFYEEDILAKKLEEENLKTISVNKEKFIHYESQTIGKSFSYFSKVKQLFLSKMYYQKQYNKIGILKQIIFYILFIFRNIELLIEVPIRKILKK